MPRVKKAAESQVRDSNLDSFKLCSSCRVKESLPRGTAVCSELRPFLQLGFLAVSSKGATDTADADLF